MRLLYLVRHASPSVHPEHPARDWPLSDRGRTEAEAIADRASSWGIKALYCSSERKAQATALIIGDVVGQQARVVDAFDELHLPDWINNADEFNELVRRVLEHADPMRPGVESSSDAAARFGSGVRIVEEGRFPAAIVSHGRILTAWIADLLSLEDPFALWRAMPMPGWASLDLDDPKPGLLTPFSN